MSIIALILLLVGLMGATFLQAVATAYRALEQTLSKEQLRAISPMHRFRSVLARLFPGYELEALRFAIGLIKHLMRLLFAVSATIFVLAFPDFLVLSIALLFIVSLLFGDFIPRYFGRRFPESTLAFASPISSLYLFLALPILLLVRQRFFSTYAESSKAPAGEVTEKIIEMIQEADVQSHEKRLLEGMATFHDRIVREVMKPRVDIVALPATTTVREAAALFDEEQYSRIPVFRESIDEVVGVLMYKDIFTIYLHQDESALDQPVEQFVKPILFIPETSHVTHLLQEFRRKKTHLAVVVDEYGGTEGLVTMEDCLEEIVGEIADETDEAEERLFTPQKEGGWIVDARMTILDIEEQFDLKVPQEGEYDTIGGYAFHRAGEIPEKGLVIHHDQFDLTILETTERSVVKVQLTPTGTKSSA